MAYDLALSDAGDLIVGGNKDLAGISGAGLIEQRMKTRLRIPRGSWIYDADGTLGSNLHRAVNMAPDRARSAVDAYVREALRPITEIQVDSIDMRIDDQRALLVLVNYRIVLSEGGALTSSEERQLSVGIPTTAGGSV